MSIKLNLAIISSRPAPRFWSNYSTIFALLGHGESGPPAVSRLVDFYGTLPLKGNNNKSRIPRQTTYKQYNTQGKLTKTLPNNLNFTNGF